VNPAQVSSEDTLENRHDPSTSLVGPGLWPREARRPADRAIGCDVITGRYQVWRADVKSPMRGSVGTGGIALGVTGVETAIVGGNTGVETGAIVCGHARLGFGKICP